MTIGYYYLHANRSLIYKPNYDGVVGDFRDSDLVRHFWFIDSQCREDAWTVLVEALALGADPKRVSELAAKWRCDDVDADNYAKLLGIRLELDGDHWCAVDAGNFTNIQESGGGFGKTKLEAMAELAKCMGLSAGKMWQRTFKQLLSVSAAPSSS